METVQFSHNQIGLIFRAISLTGAIEQSAIYKKIPKVFDVGLIFLWCTIRICHEFEVRIDKSVPWVTVFWHHEALPSDAKL